MAMKKFKSAEKDTKLEYFFFSGKFKQAHLSYCHQRTLIGALAAME